MKPIVALACLLALPGPVGAQSQHPDEVRDAPVRAGRFGTQPSSDMAHGTVWAESTGFQYVPPNTPEGLRIAFWDLIFRLERRHVEYGRAEGRKRLVEKMRENLAALPSEDQREVMLRFLRMDHHYEGRTSPASATREKVFHADLFQAETRALSQLGRREAEARRNPAYQEIFASVRALAGAGPEGLRLSQDLARLEPANPAVLRSLAQDLLDGGSLSEAIDTSREAIRLDSRHPGPYTTIASAMYARNDYEGAFEAAEAALQRDPNDRIASSILQMAKNRVPPPSAFVSAEAPAEPKHGVAKRMLFYVLSTLMGGFLIALALLRAVAGSGSRVALPAAPPPAPITTGLVGNTYRVTREIAVGGMGRVFEALDIRLDRRVAIKKMREEIGSDRRERARFLTEARTVASMKHPNIVEIHSVVTEASDIYLVFEYVDGHTVAQYLDHYGRLSFGQALWILQGAAAALEYAHAHDVIHRDLKPSNIMIGRDKMVKVMDFGVARQVKETLQTLSSADGNASGTPPFMSPEQDQGRVCKQSDIYALAVCFYQMVTGELPFKGLGASMALSKMSRSYAPPSSVVPDLPPGVDDILSWALDPEPSTRCPSPMAFLRRLQDLINIPKPPPM